jgi:hypothetical protein
MTIRKGATVYTQVGWTSFLDLNPPNPLKKRMRVREVSSRKERIKQGAKIRSKSPFLRGI